MDFLVIGNYLFDKHQQKKLMNDIGWTAAFKLD